MWIFTFVTIWRSRRRSVRAGPSRFSAWKPPPRWYPSRVAPLSRLVRRPAISRPDINRAAIQLIPIEYSSRRFVPPKIQETLLCSVRAEIENPSRFVLPRHFCHPSFCPRASSQQLFPPNTSHSFVFALSEFWSFSACRFVHSSCIFFLFSQDFIWSCTDYNSRVVFALDLWGIIKLYVLQIRFEPLIFLVYVYSSHFYC